MPYPLGSFPSFGYQARNAAIRREVAQAHSASALQAKAQYELKIEEAVYMYLDVFLTGATPKSQEGAKNLEDLRARMDRTLRYHDSGRRVYYRFLGETLSLAFTCAGIGSQFEGCSVEKLKQVTRDLGLMVLADPNMLVELRKVESQSN